MAQTNKDSYPLRYLSCILIPDSVHLTAFICVKSCREIERSLKKYTEREIIRIKCKK